MIDKKKPFKDRVKEKEVRDERLKDPEYLAAYNLRRKIAVQKWNSANPDKVRAMHVKRTYGISWDVYVELYASQNGECAVCKTPLNLYGDKTSTKALAVVDHCHTTGKVRGLLCHTCNSGIGLLKESPLLCKLASEYLERF